MGFVFGFMILIVIVVLCCGLCFVAGGLVLVGSFRDWGWRGFIIWPVMGLRGDSGVGVIAGFV